MRRRKWNSTFSKKLMAYSSIAAGVLAMAPPANAAIQYSGPKNIPVNGSTGTVFLNLDGTRNEFKFAQDYPGIMHFGVVTLDSTQGFIKTNTPNYDPKNLPANYSIKTTMPNPNTFWTNSSLLDTLQGTGSTDGNFNNKTGFIGVRFQGNCAAGHYHFGWIRYQGISSTPSNISGRIVDWAYEDTCDTPIHAGAGAAPVSTTPVPTLGEWGAAGMAAALAGAAALRIRKEKKKV